VSEISETSESAYAMSVRRTIKAINPSITDAARTYGWPAALDAVSTVLMSLLIAAVGGDEARSACSRMYEEVSRLERDWAPLLPWASDPGEGEPRGRA
jgi:hypothetical protein